MAKYCTVSDSTGTQPSMILPHRRRISQVTTFADIENVKNAEPVPRTSQGEPSGLTLRKWGYTERR